LDAVSVFRRDTYESCPLLDETSRPVPVALIRKALLVNFDFRHSDGQRIAVPTRDEDSHVAMSVLAYRAREVLQQQDLPKPILRKLLSIAMLFCPADDDTQRAWGEDDTWDRQTRDAWRALQRDESFAGLLTSLTRNFLLLAPLRDKPGRAQVEFAYETVPERRGSLGIWERLGWRSIPYAVEVPAASQPRSFHLRFEAPDGLFPTDADLVQISSESTTGHHKNGPGS